MGTILSSNKDYNRALARQPRSSIQISKFELPINFEQHPLTGTLSIPVLERNSQINNQPSVKLNESSNSELNQILIQQNISSSSNDNKTQQDQPLLFEKQSIIRSSSYSSLQPNLIMNKDAHIIYHSIINLNHHRRTNNNQLSLYGPKYSIIERNGKQYLTEIRERMERRYVQIYDETKGRMRLFEVMDYIPTRTVRSVRTNNQIPLQNETSSNSNYHSTLPTIANDQKESSNLVDFKDLNNRETVAREFDSYQRGSSLPSNNNIVSNPPSIDDYSQSKVYNNSTINSQEVSNQYAPPSYPYQAESFRHHSPTVSDYSVSTSTGHSRTSDDETDSEGLDPTLSSNTKHINNRISPDVSYGTAGGRNSPVPLDPFKKTMNQRDPYYKKRQGVHNYAEPVLKTRGFPPSTTSDYAPIPLAHKQINSNYYSRRKESSGFNP